MLTVICQQFILSIGKGVKLISVFYKLVIAVLLFLSITVNGLFGETSFRLAFQLPLNHHLSENIIHFKSEVEARSNGRIKVELRDYGTFLELKKKLITKETESKKTEYFKDVAKIWLGRKLQSLLSSSQKSAK